MSGYTTYWERTSLQCSTRAEMRKENRSKGGKYFQIHHMGCLFGVKGSLTIPLKSTCHLGSNNTKQLSIAQY